MNKPSESQTIDETKIVDVRPIPCSIKHGLIIKTWRELGVGDYFVLLNDHDPVPLRYQFAAEWPDTFSWEYLEKGPEDFMVRITKLRPLAADREGASPGAYGCSAQ